MMSSLEGGRGGEEEDACKKGGMDGDSVEPLTSAAWCPSLHVRGGRSISRTRRVHIAGMAGGRRRSTARLRVLGLDVRWRRASPQKHVEKSLPFVCAGVLRAACCFLGGGTVSLSASASDSSFASTWSSAVTSSDSCCGRLPLAHLRSPRYRCPVLSPQAVRSQQ